MNRRCFRATRSPSCRMDDNLMMYAAMVACALSVAVVPLSPASAQSPSPDPLQAAFPIRPVTGGWYRPESNFGNLNFDISDSGIAAGTWSTFRDGEVTWYYFQGSIVYPTIAQTQGDGVTAQVESPLYEVVSGSPCLTCAYVPPVLAPSGHTVRIDFTSSRAGRLVLNDTTTIPLKAWMQGLPLVTARDYSGEWLFVGRREQRSGQLLDHQEAIAQVRLEAVTGPEEYSSTVLDQEDHPETDTTPPQPGARRYRLTCTAPRETCELIRQFMVPVEPINCPTCPAGESFAMLWVDPDETGRLGIAIDRGEHGYFLQRRVVDPWVYGDRDQILLRNRNELPSGIVLSEIALQRLPAGMFDSDILWQNERLDDSTSSTPGQ